MKTKLTVTGIGSVAIIAVILIILNLISVNVFGRVDLSEGKIYSLSESSKDIVRCLDDRITIKTAIFPLFSSRFMRGAMARRGSRLPTLTASPARGCASTSSFAAS